MSRKPTSTDVSRALVSGVVAGLAASYVMNAFQGAISHFQPDEGGDAAEPATEQAADRVAAVTGTTLTDETRTTAGDAIHYLLGAVLGAGYAVAAEYEPRVAVAGGAGFGATTAIVLDEVAVPMAGLSDAPWTFPASTHLFGIASHLVFGMTVDGIRRVLRRA